MENIKFFKDFLKQKIFLSKKNEENIEKYKGFILSIQKEVLIEELNTKKETNFLIRTQEYQRFDNYSGDWMIYIELSNNYKDKFEKVFNEKINLLNASILLEKEILDFKLKNFDDYYIYKYNRELENKKMWKKTVKESNGSVIIEGLDKDIISKTELKNILKMQNNLLKREKLSDFINYIDDINFEFEFVSFRNSNVFYGFLLDIHDFLLNSDSFKKDFYIDYPCIKNKKIKKENHNKFINNFIKNRFTDNIDYSNYFLLGSTIIDSIKDIKKNIRLLNNKKVITSNYSLEELERLNKTLDFLFVKKKEKKLIENCFIKDEEYSNTYILTNENSKNLTKLMGYHIKDKFNLDDKVYKKLKKSKFEVEIKFLTY